MEILIAIAAKIAEYTVKPVGQWLCYPFYYSSNIGSMKNQVEELRVARDRVQHSIDAAITNGEEIEGDVNKWLKEVDDITELARKVLEGEEEARRKGSNGACLNLKLRHKLSQKAKKIVKDIGEVLKNGKFERVSYRLAPQGIVTTRSLDYVASKSRMLTVKRLMESLRDDNIHVIGMWGMPGVGKTTLVREVERQAKEEKLFDEVALANVTHSPDLRQIQGEIADALGLKFVEKTVLGRARCLQERLKKTEDKKILIILDDIWEYLDLKKIGIPYDHEGCKVLLTSRNQDVLVSGMDTQKDFGLEVLGKEEAWSLFEKMAGDCVKDPNLGSTATDVANACAGLPLALVTVSKALKNKSLKEWKNALRKLRKPSPGHLIKMQLTIFNSIELSYNHLESEEAKAVFLLCAQQDYDISEMVLLKYCYGLSLFPGMNTMEEVRESLYTNIRILKDCCLLLRSPYSSEILHMHDVVREAAKLIARDQNMFVVGDDGGLKEWPDVDALKTYVRFYVNGGDIHEVLPNEMQCPELRLLYVYGGDCPLQISNAFFKVMGKLRVLDLTKMQLPSLPSSLKHLTNLQTLCLDQCVLGDIAIIGELKNLAVLSLLKSDISQLPREIGLLTRLRLLDLSGCYKLKVIPPNVLSNLVALEELYMGNCFVKWDAEGLNNEKNNASIAELKHLSHLITLEIHIRDASNLPKDMSFEKLGTYIIFVGDVWHWRDKREEASKTLKLKMNTSFQSAIGIQNLLKRTENLYLDQLKGVDSILHELDSKGFQQLKHLHIQNNPEIKYIINSTMHIAFPALETFLLKNMTGLEEICHGQLPSTAFAKLRVVKVEQCDRLNFVFSSSIARGLSQLEELEIRECSIMGAIVMKEEGEIEDEDILNLFSKLRCLALQHLPKLKSLLSTQNSLVTNEAEEIISEGNLHFHMPILHEQVVCPNLETLQLSSIGLEDIQHNQHRATTSSCRLENMQSTSRFQNLLELKVKGCGNIKYLLSFSTAKFMVHLKYLSIVECKALEEILLTEDSGVVDQIIPQLEDLVLKKLPILERFCQGSNIKFPSLKDLALDHCPKLKTFISKPISLGMMTSCKELKEMNTEESPHTAVQPLFNEEVVFPNLETLQLSSIGLEDIQHNQHRATTSSCRLENMQSTSRFQNLLELKVKGCGNIKYLLSFSTAKFMVHLKYLAIGECKAMEEILLTEDLGVVEEISFPRLEELLLKELPILERFCQGSNIKFPSLKHLEIDNCPKLKTFISKPVSLGMMTSCKELKEMNTEESPHTAVQPLFNEEVAFPSLERLVISHMDDLKIIWRNQFAVDSFYELQVLEVLYCKNLVNVFQSDMLARFQSLEDLFVVDCGSLEEVFELEGLNVTEAHAVKAIQLEELYLQDLPNMRHVWSKDPKQIFSFQKLRSVCLMRCWGLKSLFPASVATCLTQLEDLRISSCVVLEEIVAGEEAAQQVARFVFPQVTVLHLAMLPRLKWFYPGVHTSEWPMLEDMLVADCPKVEIFASELPSFQDILLRESKLEIPIKQPLFLVNEAPFPSLEKLRIAYMFHLKIIWHSQFTADSFCKPQTIKVEFCENLIDRVTCAVTPTQLQELHLIHLPKLKHIWNKDPQQIFSFPSAEEDLLEIATFLLHNNAAEEIALMLETW